MNEVKEWYDQSRNLVQNHTIGDNDFLIYKGFKLTKNLKTKKYTIQDVRYSNMYSSVLDNNLIVIRDNGFIKGCDMISYQRDKLRVASYIKRSENLYDKRKKFKKELSINRKKNEKRIKNIDLKIDEYLDLHFFYTTKINQFNKKYNGKK